MGTKSVTNLSHMFSWYESLNNIPDISNLNIKNVFTLKSLIIACFINP